MANPTDKKPTIGRTVIYVCTDEEKRCTNGAEILPATVVRTWENTSYSNNEVNLKVHVDGVPDWWNTSVPHSSDKEPGTWHWPEIQ